MAREDWDIRGIECCTFRNDEEELETCDVYVWNSLFGEIRVREIKNLLNLSPQRFVDLLNEPYELPDGSKNKRHLITNEEESFRAHERHHIKDPYFTRKKVFTNNLVTINMKDFESWLDDNYNLLMVNNVNKNANDRTNSNAFTIENQNIEELLPNMNGREEQNINNWLFDYPICALIKEWHEKGMSSEDIRNSFNSKNILTDKQSSIVIVCKNDNHENNDWLIVYPVCKFIKDSHEKNMSRKMIFEGLKKEFNLTVLHAGSLTKKNASYQSNDALKKATQRLK